jgi:hypothetical protein
LLTLQDNPVEATTHAAFSPDGRVLAVGVGPRDGKAFVRLWYAAPEQEPARPAHAP